MKGLNPSGGLIVIKENVSDEDVFDHSDSSVTRCIASFYTVIQKAGLKVIKEEEQEKFPSDLYTIKMYGIVHEMSLTGHINLL